MWAIIWTMGNIHFVYLTWSIWAKPIVVDCGHLSAIFPFNISYCQHFTMFPGSARGHLKMENFTLSVIIWFGKWPDQHLYYLQPHPHIMYYHFHFNHHPLYIHLHICGTKIFVNILRCSQQETSKNEKWHFHCNHHPLCPSSYLAKGRENKHLSTGYIDFSATAAQTYNLHHTIKVWHSPFLILWSKQILKQGLPSMRTC